MAVVRDSIYAREGGENEPPYVVDQVNGYLAGVRETYSDGSIMLYICVVSQKQSFVEKTAEFTVIGLGYDKVKNFWYNFTPNEFYKKTNNIVVNNLSYVNYQTGLPCNKEDDGAIPLADFWVGIYKLQIFPAIQHSILGTLNSKDSE